MPWAEMVNDKIVVMKANLEVAPVLSSDYSDVATTAQIDAIIVPTARSANSLAFAAELARETGACLLALCSGNSSAVEVGALLSAAGAKGTALDVPPHYTNELLAGFATDTFTEATYGRANNDISLKRNLALILARLTGWENVFFLDDDIKGINSENLERATSILSEHSAVGFQVTAFPDNSVVRHAQRLVGVDPGVQMSGGALVVNATIGSMGFFPNIYNEDWFFLYDSQSAFYASITAEQQSYDPFSNPMRAASEEFGDILAEGIVEMQVAGINCGNASEADWNDILVRRRGLIHDLQSSLEISGVAESEGKAALKALEAAKARHANITAATCRAYIKAWRQDVALWRGRLNQLPSFLSTAEATRELGLAITPPRLSIPTHKQPPVHF